MRAASWRPTVRRNFNSGKSRHLGTCRLGKVRLQHLLNELQRAYGMAKGVRATTQLVLLGLEPTGLVNALEDIDHVAFRLGAPYQRAVLPDKLGTGGTQFSGDGFYPRVGLDSAKATQESIRTDGVKGTMYVDQ